MDDSHFTFNWEINELGEGKNLIRVPGRDL